VALLAVVVFCRRPDAILNPQFWGEDGNVYFLDQLTVGFWPALAKLWNSFPYLIQRLIAALGAGLPLAAAPLVYSVSTILITALAMAMFSLPGFRHLVARDTVRAAACVAAVCIPAGQELLATSTNVGWFLAVWLALLAVMRAPRSALLFAGCCVGGAVAVASTPLAPVSAPLWMLRAAYGAVAARRRDLAFALTQLGAFVATVLVAGSLGAGDPVDVDGSLVALQTSGAMIFRWYPAHLVAAVKLVPFVAAWCIGTAILPTRMFAGDASSWGMVTVAVPALLLVGSLALAFRDLPPRGRTTVGLAAYLFLASLFLVLAGRHNIVRGFQAPSPGMNASTILFSRYRVLPYFALVLAAAAIIDSARHSATRVAAALVVGCIGLFAWAPGFRIPPFTDYGWPLWADRLEHEIRDGTRDPLVIPINPEPYRIVFDPAAPLTRPSGTTIVPGRAR
jgi:hypothetical protein